MAPSGAVQSRATAKQDVDWLVRRSVGWFGAQIMHARGKYGSNIRPIMYSPRATIVGPAGAVVPPARALARALALALAPVCRATG